MSDPIDILSKLFETLKDASNRNEQATDKLIAQQLDLVSHIKAMPVEDLKLALREHAKKSTQEIVDCNGTIELRTADIMEEIKKLSHKVTKLLIVVSVTITVATSGYFLIRYAAEKNQKLPVDWQQKYEKIESEQQNIIDTKLEKLMKEIREEMRKLHSEKNNGEKK